MTKSIWTNLWAAAGLAMLASQGVAAAAPPATFLIATKGEELAFDKTELAVKPGQKVKLIFKNLSSMQHNWVLVKPGTADAVANESLSAGNEKGWLAKGPNVLANTKMLDGKKSDTIEFTAPAQPGDYPFICTFPGHSSIMRGVLKVK